MKTTKEMIEVMQAYVDGDEIEATMNNCLLPWEGIVSPVWNWADNTYRVAKKTKQVKLEAWLTPSGFMSWYKEGTGPGLPNNWKRVPSEDKTIEIEE